MSVYGSSVPLVPCYSIEIRLRRLKDVICMLTNQMTRVDATVLQNTVHSI